MGALNAGTSANIIPDSAELLINTRAYSRATRETILAAIDRIVRAQCVAGRSPKDPEIEVYDSYPLTSSPHQESRGPKLIGPSIASIPRLESHMRAASKS